MVPQGELALTNRDSIFSNSGISDTIVANPEPDFVLLMEPPEVPKPELRSHRQDGTSYILGALFLLFLIIALRFRNNMKYIWRLSKDLIDTRIRHNVFDDTVRETSLIFLLNTLWCVSTGIIIYYSFSFFNSGETAGLLPWLGIVIGISLAVAYTLFMLLAYFGVGWIFSDGEHARLWTKGFTASQALMSPLYFIIALLAIGQPQLAPFVTISAVIVFFAIRLLFIWKGLKIFFNHKGSYLLYLYYLCSLEVVPLILLYRAAIKFCN